MPKLVLADDDDDFRDLYAQALRAQGHEVHEAAEGKAALEIIRRERPDLLLLDLWMPDTNGFEVLEALRYDPSGIRLRIVVLSNLGDAENRLAAFEAGAGAYLVKGRSLADGLAVIAGLLDEQAGSRLPALLGPSID